LATQSQRVTPDITFARLLGVSMAARFLVDTGIQTFSPFLPMIAAGLGVDIVTLGRLLSVQNLVGLASPALGAAAERRGYRLVMRFSLLSGALGFLLIGVSRQLALALAGMVLIGLCLAGFIPTLVAYLSARLPYARRARGLGILEYSWALSGIVGMLLVGQLIAVAGWRAPFFIISVGLGLMVILFGLLPATKTEYSQEPLSGDPIAGSWRQRLTGFFDLGAGARSAYSAILASSLNFIALMQFNLAYGAWLSERYGIGPAQLGTVALLLGCFDLCASVSVSLFTDRLGKRRSVLLGAGGGVVGYACLPFFDVGLAPAVVAFAVTRGFAEFFLVSILSLLSEQAPSQRAKVMTLNVAAMQIGFTIAGFSGPWLYTYYGVSGLAICSTLVLAVGGLVVWLRVRERGGEE
jgi:predicted MFS family arabinose efflux permease